MNTPNPYQSPAVEVEALESPGHEPPTFPFGWLGMCIASAAFTVSVVMGYSGMPPMMFVFPAAATLGFAAILAVQSIRYWSRAN